MPNTRIGFDGLTLQEKPGSPKIIKKSPTNVRILRMFSCNAVEAEAAILAFGVKFGDSFGVPYVDSVVTTIAINADGPKNAEVVFTYQPLEVSSEQGDLPPPGTLILESDSNAIEIPLGLHPKRSDGVNYDPDKKIGKGPFEGVEAVLSPQPIFRRTETLDDFTFTEANIIKNVARRFTAAQMLAKGLNAATLNKWLKMGLSIRTSGTNFEQSETWQFAENGWDTDLYDAAT